MKMSKKPIFIVLVILKQSVLFCQHTELNIAFQTGVFGYKTNTKVEPFFSMLNEGTAGSSNIVYPNNSWGTHSQFPYCISLDTRRVTKRKNLLGILLSYESLTTSKELHYIFHANAVNLAPATGKCTLQNNFFTMTMYFGRRLKFGILTDDITAGFYIGLSKFHHEWGYATDQATQVEYKFDLSSNTSQYEGFTNADAGYTFQNILYHKRFGLSIAYSGGVQNFEGNTSADKTYSKFFKAGIVFKLLK